MKNNGLHIAFVIGSMRTGGAERATLHLANSMSDAGLNVDLVLLHRSGEFLNLVSESVNIVNLNRRKASEAIGVFSAYLKASNPDIILSVQNHIQLMTVLGIRKINWKGKLILNEQSTYSKNLRGAKGFLQKLVSKYLFKRANAITAVSEGVKIDLEKNLPELKSKMRVIPNPIVTQHLYDVKDAVVSNPFLNSEFKVIVSAGRFIKSKNFELLIRAFEILKRTDPVKLILLGDGIEMHAFKKLIKELNLESDISLPGFVADPCTYFSKADLFVLSSDYEGLPGVIIEALACGCKVVSTNCEHGPSEILKQGQYGWLTPIGDRDQLAAAMKQALSSNVDKQQLIDRANEYHEKIIIQQYFNLFYQLDIDSINQTSKLYQ